METEEKQGRIRRMKKIWGKVSYETAIFILLMVNFLVHRSPDLVEWSSAWLAMDYSMGPGSRLFIGSIHRLFYGDWLDYTMAYKYVSVGIALTILILSLTLGRLMRMAIKNAPDIKYAVFGTAAVYLVSPFSIAYVWNYQNLGRLDVYMLLVSLLAVYAALAVENVYLKFLLYTVLGCIGLAIHQGYAFLYYPMVLTVMCYDVFRENRVHGKSFICALLSGAVNIAAAIFWQFGSHINFDGVAEVADYLATRTNVEIVNWAIEIEYFQDIEYQLKEITSKFFEQEAPFMKLFLICLLLSPVLFLYILVWKDVFSDLIHKKAKLLASPYLYALLVNLLFVPMFAIHTDWGRHIAPLFAMPTFVFLFFLAKGEASMLYAYQKMKCRILKYPWIFLLLIVWAGIFETFGARIFQYQADRLYDFIRYGLTK